MYKFIQQHAVYPQSYVILGVVMMLESVMTGCQVMSIIVDASQELFEDAKNSSSLLCTLNGNCNLYVLYIHVYNQPPKSKQCVVPYSLSGRGPR